MTQTPAAPAEPAGPDASRPDPSGTLRQLAGGHVHLPGDPGYDEARVPWNLAVDQRPAAVAEPRSAEEVVELVRAAAALGLEVVPQSTGHGASPFEGRDLGCALLLRMSGLSGAEVDPERRTVRVLGGTRWQDVVPAVAAHGLAVMHGSAPDVAVAGYLLGGGLSFYGRRHGLAAHSIRSVELVLADGSRVRADAEHNRDLWWAVRGGGSVGVVVAVELDLLPISDVHAGMLLWDAAHAADVLGAWIAWTREAPETATTSWRVMSFPPLPELPPFLSGRRVVIVDGAVLEDDERAAELLAPLRLLEPELDTFARIPAADLVHVHLDPPAPTPAVSRHRTLGPLDELAVETLLGHNGPDSSLLFTELRHLGGALGRAGSGALDRLDGDYALFCVAVAPDPDTAERGVTDARAAVDAMAPWAAGRRLLNFTDEAVDTSSAYDAAGWERLRAVRVAADPQGRIVGNHAVR